MGQTRKNLAATSTLTQPCIRCGWCVWSCPESVHPAGLLEAAQQDDLEMAERFGMHACTECGECERVCPSRLPLGVSIHKLKSGRK
jgi:electron transport complex protein RnfC